MLETIQEVKNFRQLEQSNEFENPFLKETPVKVVSEFRRVGHLISKRSNK